MPPIHPRCYRPITVAVAAAIYLGFGTGLTAQGQLQTADTVIPPDVTAAVAGGGDIPVIIQLAPAKDFQPEATLSAAASANQQAAMALSRASVMATLKAAGVSAVSPFTTIPFIAARVDARALDQLRSSPDVLSVRQDERRTAQLSQSTAIVRANIAWGAGITGAGWTVAVLDSGVDKAHPFLAGKVVSEACYSNNAGFGGGFSLCPGGVTASVASGSAAPCLFDCAHGTHVAGIAAGKGSTMSGVARDASLIAIQVFTWYGPGDLSANDSDIIRGLERVYALRNTHAIAAVNLSVGGGLRFFAPCDASYFDYKFIIDVLRSVGIAVVISSGNQGYSNSLSAPACVSTAVSVASSNDGSEGTFPDVVSNLSNTAYFLSLLAPGRWITSSIPGGGFDSREGTSMAAPHVAGAWALMKQRMPSASVATILNAFWDTGVYLEDPLSGLFFPRIDVAAAVSSIGLVAPAISSHPVGSTISPGRNATLSVGATGSAPLSYQWYRGNSGDTSSPAPGATASIYVTPALVTTTSYWARVSNPVGSANSNAAVITVRQPEPFTDPTLTSGLTTIRLIHINELRTRIQALRLRVGLGAYAWTDGTITPGITTIKAAHLQELRAALANVYQAVGASAPAYTDSVLVPQVTPMKAIHIAELRTAVIALE